MWVNDWRKLLDFCYSMSPILIFESNGNSDEQLEQVNYIKSYILPSKYLAESRQMILEIKRMFSSTTLRPNLNVILYNERHFSEKIQGTVLSGRGKRQMILRMRRPS